MEATGTGSSTGENRPRKPNWTDSECFTLVRLIEENKGVIRSKFNSSISAQTKRKTWEKITASINSMNPHVKRDRNEVEKKWHNILMKSKKELSEHSQNTVKTGGGPPGKPLSVLAAAVGDIIGRDNVCIQGIGSELQDSSFYQLNTVSSQNQEATGTTSYEVPIDLDILNTSLLSNDNIQLPSDNPSSPSLLPIISRPTSTPLPRKRKMENLNDENLTSLQIKNLKLSNDNLLLQKENLQIKNEILQLKLKMLRSRSCLDEN